MQNSIELEINPRGPVPKTKVLDNKIPDKSPPQELTQTIQESLRIATPAWPLQNSVAVNPFWFVRHESFHSAVDKLTPAIHASLFMPLKYYLERITNHEITESALMESLEINRLSAPELPRTINEFIRSCQEEETLPQHWKTFSEQYDTTGNWHTRVISEIGKYCAAYFDDKQAIARFPWRGSDFWKGWLQSQKLDASMERLGATGFHAFIRELGELGAEAGIARMLQRMGITSTQAQMHYMQRLTANVLGWTSQFKYAEWQRQLGYPVENKAEARDLLAVRMAYDFGLFCISERKVPSTNTDWRNSFEGNAAGEQSGNQSFLRHSVLQLAFELSYQKQIASQLKGPLASNKEAPKAQLSFCIDVRSEMLRRHVERSDNKLQTLGFAGFFGVPFDYKPIGESKVSHRLPVLLTPAFEVKEESLPNSQGQISNHNALGQVASFFRSLRKNPLSSFLYVELFGALYVEKMIKRTFLSLIERIMGPKIPDRFNPSKVGPSLSGATTSQGSDFDNTLKIERAAAVLRHMGLTDSFAPLVFLLGHGSATTNNAFGSSLDCGACGGHAGDINARFLADLLNDLNIRKGISLKGIHIPETTWFVSGVHETVTDEVHILDTEKVPAQFQRLLQEVKNTLLKASHETRAERQFSRSRVLDPRANRRSLNWSEIRPEWGLAGNACFIIAPRQRTIHMNLSSRAFLHDYDWSKDEKSNYQTLELIMTAPMIVTNWINLQYYASTVAPQVYGAGNKLLHNLTNETGVLEGNGGDLRVGLSLQSIHDGHSFVHEPLRLSVFIEAPRDKIESMIEKHLLVRELIEHEWLHLIHIDPITLKSERRLRGGIYSKV